MSSGKDPNFTIYFTKHFNFTLRCTLKFTLHVTLQIALQSIKKITIKKFMDRPEL